MVPLVPVNSATTPGRMARRGSRAPRLGPLPLLPLLLLLLLVAPPGATASPDENCNVKIWAIDSKLKALGEKTRNPLLQL